MSDENGGISPIDSEPIFLDFYIFRIKLIFPFQVSLHHDKLERSELLTASIQSKPSARLRGKSQWRIGNVEMFSRTRGVFAIGRTTNSKVEKYDETRRQFFEEELDSSPFTQVVFDSELGMCAIAKKPRLSTNILTIARQLRVLLQYTTIIRKNEIQVLVDPIPDPQDFIRRLKEAYAIKRFTITFSRPNPFDVDRFFQKPMTVYLEATDGEDGRTTISGKKLDAEVCSDVTRSVAATGNTAEARLVREKGRRPEKVTLRGEAAKYRIEESLCRTEVSLQLAESRYHQVRGDGQ